MERSARILKRGPLRGGAARAAVSSLPLPAVRAPLRGIGAGRITAAPVPGGAAVDVRPGLRPGLDTMPPARLGRDRWAALLASLLLHGSVAAAVWLVPAPAPDSAAADDTVIEVTLLPVETMPGDATRDSLAREAAVPADSGEAPSPADSGSRPDETPVDVAPAEPDRREEIRPLADPAVPLEQSEVLAAATPEATAPEATVPDATKPKPVPVEQAAPASDAPESVVAAAEPTVPAPEQPAEPQQPIEPAAIATAMPPADPAPPAVLVPEVVATAPAAVEAALDDPIAAVTRDASLNVSQPAAVAPPPEEPKPAPQPATVAEVAAVPAPAAVKAAAMKRRAAKIDRSDPAKVHRATAKTEPRQVAPVKAGPRPASQPAPAAGSPDRGRDAATRTKALASRAGPASLGTATLASWKSQVQAAVMRARPSPDHDREGRVGVMFAVGQAGALLSASVTASSGSPALDAASLAAVRRAAPFPPVPDGSPAPVTLTVSIQFRIDD